MFTHDICLRSDSDQSVDMLADWHQHFTRHVSALLGPRRLIFNMNAGGTVLDEQLGQLHDGCKTTMTCVSIRNDRSEEISICNAATVGFGSGDSLFSLFAVVKELSQPQLMDLVWNSVLLKLSEGNRDRKGAAVSYHWVVSKIRRWLVRRRGGGRALPAGHVDGVQVFGHLREHRRLQTSVCEAGVSCLDHSLNQPHCLWQGLLPRQRTLNLPSMMLHSFLLIALLGY